MFVNQKTLEICYALIRLAAQVRRVELKSRIEKLAYQFLEEVGLQNFDNALKTSSAIESYLNLGQSLYEIEPNNGKIVIGELESINSAMRQSVGLEGMPDFTKIFSKESVSSDIRQESGNSASYGRTMNDIRTNIDSSEHGNGNNGNGISATIRQSAILDKIRQSEGQQIQLKDIIAAFPEVSERTMRYDLQKLCSQGLLVRIGSGGPGSYYLAKKGV